MSNELPTNLKGEQGSRTYFTGNQIPQIDLGPSFPDEDGQPVYVGSAYWNDTIQPGKVKPGAGSGSPCLFAKDGEERQHDGSFDVLNVDPTYLQWADVRAGGPPDVPGPLVKGGTENGYSIFHALGVVNGLQVPGKTYLTAEGTFSQAYFAFGGKEYPLDDFQVLYAKSDGAPFAPSGLEGPRYGAIYPHIPDSDIVGQAPFSDGDGSPVYVGSALADLKPGEAPQWVPSKIKGGQGSGPLLYTAFDGQEIESQGRYNILYIDPQRYEWIDAAAGNTTPNRAVQGGVEFGQNVYHALGVVDGVTVPGKFLLTNGDTFSSGYFSFGGKEVELNEYKALVHKA